MIRQIQYKGLSIGTDYQEIEWQYEAPYSLQKVEEWLVGRDHGGFGLAALRGFLKKFTDIYYDTEDWQLYHTGYALRVRQEVPDKDSEVTMKSLVAANGNLHRRREMSESLKSDKHDMLFMTPGPIGVRLRKLVSPRELRPIFEVRTRRQTFDLLLDEQPKAPGKVRTDSSADVVRVGEVALDNSEIPLGDGSVCLTRVEVEVDASVTSASSKLEGFVKAMEGALGLRPAAMSKYEAGLSVTGQNPNGEPSLKAKAESKGRKKK